MMAMFQDIDDPSLEGQAFVIRSDESHVLSVGSAVKPLFDGGVQSDHVTGDVFPSTNGLYVVTVCQEETALPVKQIGTKILFGG